MSYLAYIKMSETKTINQTGNKIYFGTSFNRQTVLDIDRIRGDVPRSRWLQRLAVQEVERLKKAERSSVTVEE